MDFLTGKYERKKQPQGIVSDEQADALQREGIVSRMKDVFKSSTGNVDEFGVEKPKTQSKVSTFLDYLLPSLFTVAGGAGLPLGLMAGRAMHKAKGDAADKSYQEKRKAAWDVMSDKAKAELERQKMEEAARHNRAAEGIGRSNAAAAWRPSEKERMLEKYLKGTGEMEDIRGLADKATPEQPLAPQYSKRFDELKRQEEAYSGALFPKTIGSTTPPPSKPFSMTQYDWDAYQDLDAKFKDPKQKAELSDAELQQYQILKRKIGQ